MGICTALHDWVVEDDLEMCAQCGAINVDFEYEEDPDDAYDRWIEDRMYA